MDSSTGADVHYYCTIRYIDVHYYCIVRHTSVLFVALFIVFRALCSVVHRLPCSL